ncbi:MAG: MarR family winged helix-turn-helix transcriptional regulator [Christensenellales bacterium]|jgi:DNA-binding MarR family transcriptional regulator
MPNRGLPESNETNELLISTCMRFVKLSRMLEIKLRRSPAHMARMRLMLAMRHKDELTLPELSNETCVSTSSLSLMLKQLDQEGLVNRESKPSDGRITLYSLTENGRNYLHQEYNNRRRAMSDLVSDVDLSSFPNISEHLQVVLEIVRAITSGKKKELRVPSAQPEPDEAELLALDQPIQEFP